MTALAPHAAGARQGSPRPVPVPWRRLARATWRQHWAALAGLLLVIGLIAVVLAVTGVPAHAIMARQQAIWYEPLTQNPYGMLFAAVLIVMQLLPVGIGVFLGAPLLAREAEQGTKSWAWTQDASRTRWFLARVAPMGALLALAAFGLSLELRWWLGAFLPPRIADWQPQIFDLLSWPFLGWTTAAFCLGVLAGAVIRRTVPAMASTTICYAALLYATSAWWRLHYLPPLVRGMPYRSAGGAFLEYGGGPGGPGPVFVSSYLGWPDRRPLSVADGSHAQAWYSQHHIMWWTVYQPGSRFLTFQHIELGWLAALSAVLVAVTLFLIRRPAKAAR